MRNDLTKKKIDNWLTGWFWRLWNPFGFRVTKQLTERMEHLERDFLDCRASWKELYAKKIASDKAAAKWMSRCQLLSMQLKFAKERLREDGDVTGCNHHLDQGCKMWDHWSEVKQ